MFFTNDPHFDMNSLPSTSAAGGVSVLQALKCKCKRISLYASCPDMIGVRFGVQYRR